jgi:hypothetical protein
MITTVAQAHLAAFLRVETGGDRFGNGRVAGINPGGHALDDAEADGFGRHGHVFGQPTRPCLGDLTVVLA